MLSWPVVMMSLFKKGRVGSRCMESIGSYLYVRRWVILFLGNREFLDQLSSFVLRSLDELRKWRGKKEHEDESSLQSLKMWAKVWPYLGLKFLEMYILIIWRVAIFLGSLAFYRLTPLHKVWNNGNIFVKFQQKYKFWRTIDEKMVNFSNSLHVCSIKMKLCSNIVEIFKNDFFQIMSKQRFFWFVFSESGSC